MTDVRKFLPVNRLAKALSDPTGMLISHALRSAAANVEKIRPEQLAALDRKLLTLREHAPMAHATPEQAAAFYRLAQDVLADSSAVGFAHLSRAALSLCDLLVSGVSAQRMRGGVAVHLDAMTALRAAPGDGANAQRDAILAGLAQLSGGRAP